jgi:hypothetical protein
MFSYISDVWLFILTLYNAVLPADLILEDKLATRTADLSSLWPTFDNEHLRIFFDKDL